MSFLKAMPAQFLSVTITFWNRQRAANVKPSTLRRHIEFDPRLPDSDLEEIRHQVNAWADRQIVKARWELSICGNAGSQRAAPYSTITIFSPSAIDVTTASASSKASTETSDRQGRGGPNH